MLPTLEALGKVAIALTVSIAASVVITAATFVIAAAIGVTSTFALAVGATALFLSGIGGGQAFRATSNVLNGKNWDNGLFNGQDMVVDGALSVITFGIFSKFTGGGITTFGAQGLNAGRQALSAVKNLLVQPKNTLRGGANNLPNPLGSNGLGVLTNRPITPTQKGLDIIKQHLSNPLFSDDGRTVCVKPSETTS